MDTNNSEEDKISKIIPDDLSDLSFEELQLFHPSVGNADIPNETKPPDEAKSITYQSSAGIGRTPPELGISPALFAELDEALDKSGLLTNSGCTQKISNCEANLEGPDLSLPNYRTKDIKTLEISSFHHIGSTMHSETHPKPGNLEGQDLNLPNNQLRDIKMLEIISALNHSGYTIYWENHPTPGTSGNLEGQDLNLPNYQSKDIKTLEMFPALDQIGYTLYWETHPTPETSNGVSSTPVEPRNSNPTSSQNFASYIEDSNMDPKYFQASDKQRTACQRTTRSYMQELQNSNADEFTDFYEEDARSLHGEVSVEAEFNIQSRVDASIDNSALSGDIRCDLNWLINDETKKFVCELCGETFFTKSFLITHYIVRHGI